MRIRASKSKSYPLLNKNKHILLCLCLLPGTLPLGVSLAGSALQPFLPRAADRFLQVSSVSYHLWELLISSLHFQVPFLPLSSLANKVCLDPLTPWIFTVADHIECKWVSLCHAPGIILIDLQFSSVSILETSFLICHTIASTFVCGWIMLMTHGHTVNDYFQSGLSPFLTLAQFSLQLTANPFISVCVPDLAPRDVKFNLIFIASLLKIIRSLLYGILTFLSVNIISQICVISYYLFLCPVIANNWSIDHIVLRTSILLASSSFSVSCYLSWSQIFF